MDWTNNTATLAMNNLTPSISTVSATSITVNSAISGGNIVNQGSSAVTGRGVCWNTTGNPTIANNRTSNGTGTGTFTSNITGLTSCTSYYVRAYGTNSSGTSYGTQITFKTLGCLVTDNVYVSSFTANSTSLRPGQIISVDGTINANAKTITGCSVGLYFSVNAQWEPKTDVLIKEFKTTFTLGSSTFTTSYTLPLTTPFGTYYIICVADNTNDITETDETDNVKYVKITVL
jgi:hypothetical protein